MVLLIKPIEPVFFRWHGEYSPNFSGPMNKGISEPLPLISTVIGAIYRKVKGIKIAQPSNELEELKSVFNDVWGPLIYVKGSRRNTVGEFLLVHDYPGKLITFRLEKDGVTPIINEHKDNDCINEEAKEGDCGVDMHKYRIDEIMPKQINKIGIGRDLGKRTAKEHMLYSSQFIDLQATIMENFKDVTEWGILVETQVKYNGVMELGGEGRVVKVNEVDVQIPTGGKYSALLSPLLLSVNNNVGNERLASLDDVLKLNIDGKINDKTLRNVLCRGKIGVIGIGYSMSLNARRPIYPALFPGSLLRNINERKLGELNELGWGSLLHYDYVI